jgi:hypothetical protein
MTCRAAQPNPNIRSPEGSLSMVIPNPPRRGRPSRDGDGNEQSREPHSYAQSAEMSKQPAPGEHAAEPRRIARIEDEHESVEDLAGEPMREGPDDVAGSEQSGSRDNTRGGVADANDGDDVMGDMPDELEALGDMPVGAGDAEKDDSQS